MNYSESETIVRDILKIKGKTAQFEAVKQIECEKRRAHVIELLKLHYKGLSCGFTKF